MDAKPPFLHANLISKFSPGGEGNKAQEGNKANFRIEGIEK